MKMITAIVRASCFEGVVKSLGDIGIRGITISEVKGTGEQVSLYKPYTIHNKLEIIVPDDKVEEVTGIILEYARMGMAGDGLITVSPLDYTIKIRTKEKLG